MEKHDLVALVAGQIGGAIMGVMYSRENIRAELDERTVARIAHQSVDIANEIVEQSTKPESK